MMSLSYCRIWMSLWLINKERLIKINNYWVERNSLTANIFVFSTHLFMMSLISSITCYESNVGFLLSGFLRCTIVMLDFSLHFLFLTLAFFQAGYCLRSSGRLGWCSFVEISKSLFSTLLLASSFSCARILYFLFYLFVSYY